MVSRIGGGGHKSAISRRQLPITGSAHNATVVCDAAVAAVLTTFDMAAKRGGAAILDRRHHLELG
jgi:hypothetical protein